MGSLVSLLTSRRASTGRCSWALITVVLDSARVLGVSMVAVELRTFATGSGRTSALAAYEVARIGIGFTTAAFSSLTSRWAP